MKLSTNKNISTFCKIGTGFLALRKFISEKDFNALLSVMKKIVIHCRSVLISMIQYEKFKTKIGSSMTQNFNSMVPKNIYMKQLPVIRAV